MRVFVSYAHSDKELVKETIVNVLRVDGHNVWWDEELYIGHPFSTQIQEQIVECEAFIFVVTKASLASEYCQLEFDLALKKRRRVVPIIMEPELDLPHTVRILQYVNFSPDVSMGIHTLRESLQELEQHERLRSAQSLATRQRLFSIIAIVILVLILFIGLYIASNNPPPPTPTATSTLTPTATPTILPSPTATPEDILREISRLINAEATAAQDGNFILIEEIFAVDAIIRDDGNNRVYGSPADYYLDKFDEVEYCSVIHHSIRIVQQGADFVRATSASRGTWVLRPGTVCTERFDNPAGSDQWEFRRNAAGQWEIVSFTFN